MAHALSPSSPLHLVFPGSSEMARRMRCLDWEATALGCPSRWPVHLRCAVALCLTSEFPILLWWGPELRLLYNDACISFLGPAKHPDMLSRPGHECWPEIWHTAGPLLHDVMQSGQASSTQDVQYFFARQLPCEEVHVRFAYGPILSPQGKVDGVFTPCTETTTAVVGTRRLQTLSRLCAPEGPTSPLEAACATAIQVLKRNPHDLPFAALYLSEDGTGRLIETTAQCGQTGLPALVSPVSAGGISEAIASALNDPDGTRVWEGQDAALRLPGGPYPEATQRWSVIQLPLGGGRRAALVVGFSPRQPIDGSYRAFMALLGCHIAKVLAAAFRCEKESARVDELAQIDHAKTLFFNKVSHEFRTPLTLILAPLHDKLSGQGEALTREETELIYRNARRLQKMVNSLLDFSRIEAGRMQPTFRPVDLVRVTTDIASVYRSTVEKGGLQLKLEFAPLQEPIFIDQDMYERIVLNLIANAFKFTLKGSITLQLADTGRAVELSVSDTGCGIAESQLPFLFQRFHRIEGAVFRPPEGTGIGLAVAQGLAQLHGGSIRVHSRPAQGSVFTVSLLKGCAHLPADRISRPHDEAERGGSTDAAHLQGLAADGLPDNESPAADAAPDLQRGELDSAPRARIVWAEDNPDMRTYVARLLSPRYEVEAVPDGLSALQAVRDRLPDLLISDVMMSGHDGFELLRLLRADAKTRDLPVILLSARAGEEARLEGKQAGADEYLVKPFTARELLAHIEAQLRLARLRRETTEALRQSEERFRLIVAQMPAGVGVMDPAGHWTFSNPMMDQFTPHGVPSASAERMSHWRSWDQEGQLIAPDQWPSRRALRGETVLPGLEMLYTDSEGTDHWMRVSAAPLRDGQAQVIGACALVQDVTPLKKAEQALLDADRRKDEFLATLSHELRNPLAPIRNGLQLLQRPGQDAASQARIVGMLDRQVAHLVRLVDDLLEISRITRGKVELRKQPMELAAVLQAAVEISTPLIEAAGHRLTLQLPDEPLPLNADPVRLSQIFSNLLNNAAKYTPPGGSIWVAAQREGPCAMVSVRDSGMGIPRDMLPKVFDLFTQAERTYGRAQGGLGIGLTLVRQLVELHGGQVEAHSEGAGRGSEFLVRLPLGPAA